MTQLKPRLPLAGRLGAGTPRFPRLETGSPFHPTSAQSSTESSRPRAAAVESHRPWAPRYRIRLRITDTAIVLAAIGISYVARFSLVDAGVSVVGTTSSYIEILPAIVVTWLLALGAAHTRDARIVGLGTTEYKRIASRWVSRSNHAARASAGHKNRYPCS